MNSQSLPSMENLNKLLVEHPVILLDLALDPPELSTLPKEYIKLLQDGSRLLKNEYYYLKEKLDIILMQPDPGPSLQWLEDTLILKWLIPELHDTVNLSDETERRHKHVWDHTKQVVKQSENDLSLRWAALFHDIGKVQTRSFTQNKVTFYAHDIVGAGMFRKISKRFSLEKRFSKKIYKLIKYHLRPGQYSESWTDSAVRRIVKEVGENTIFDLLKLGRADITSKRPGKREAGIKKIDRFEERIIEIIKLDSKQPPLPKGLGNIILENSTISAGPELGKMISWLKNEIEKENLMPQQDFNYYIQALSHSPHSNLMK